MSVLIFLIPWIVLYNLRVEGRLTADEQSNNLW